MFSRQSVTWLIILCSILVVLALPRFNRVDTGIKAITSEGTGKLGDAAFYVAMTQYFRGEQITYELRPPFTYRPLIPFLASLLPFDAMTGINVINLIAMIIAVIFMYKILMWFNLGFKQQIIGCGLFVISFPTFYYSTVGYIDPVLISFLTIGLYLILTNKWIYLVILITIGVLVKETIIILILILTAYLILYNKIFTKQGLILLPIIISSGIAFYLTRKIIPVDPGFAWTPSFETLIFNISRPRSWLSAALSFGIPGILSLFIFRFRKTDWFHEKFKEIATLITGLVISIFLFGVSMLSAYADGRFIWTSYPFSIPLAVMVFKEIIMQKENQLPHLSPGMTQAIHSDE